MPSAPQRYCAEQGCSEKGTGTRCEVHQRTKRQHERRHYSGVRGVNYGRRWSAARLRYLAEHPWCVQCPASSLTFATELDHIVPHKGDYDRFWDPQNWQGLCSTHHRKKTALEVGFSGNHP